MSPKPQPSRSKRPVAAKKPAAEGDALTPQFALAVFVRWWKLILPVGVAVSAIAATVIILQFDPVYRSSAIIRISRPPHIAFGDHGIADTDNFVATQLQLLRTPVVLGPVMADPDVSKLPELEGVEDAVAALARYLRVAPMGRSQLYRIEFVSASPIGAKAAVDSVIEEYLSQNSEYQSQQYNSLLEQLRTQKELQQLDVEAKRLKLMQLSKDRTGRDPWNGVVTDPDVSLTNGPLAVLHRQMTENESRRVVLLAEIESLRDADLTTRSAMMGKNSGLLALKVAGDPRIRAKESEIHSLERQIDELSYFHGPGYPRRARLADALAKRQTELEELKPTVEKKILDREDVERRHTIETKENELARLVHRKGELRTQFDAEVGKVQDGSGLRLEYVFAQGELSRSQAVYNAIAQRELALKVEKGRPSEISMLHPASIPRKPISKLPYKNLFICAVASLALPYGGFFLYEFLRRKIYDADQLRRELQVPVVGEVARLPKAVVSRNRSGAESRVTGMGLYTESIDIMQTNLLLSQAFRRSSILAVTSSISGEGKTCVAVQLARSIARSTGEPTLLIDGDLRAPDVAEHLMLDSEPGLIEVLAGESELADSIQSASFAELSVLPAGRPRRHSGDLLRSPRFEEMLQVLREKYAYIIFDTPPVLGASESLIICREADSVLFCCMRDYTVASQVRNAVNRLEQAGASVAGSMLNGTPQASYAYKYGRYYASRHETVES